MRAFIVAMAIAGPLLGAGMAAHAASLQACEQTVEYTIQPPGTDVPETLRGFSGVWIGKMDTGLCIATIVNSISPDGSAQITYVNGSMGGQYPVKAGNRKITAKIVGGKLTTSGSNVSTDYTLRGTNELVFSYVHKTAGRSMGLLKRQ